MACLKTKSFESETLLDFAAVDACSDYVSFLVPVYDTVESHTLMLFPLFEALLNLLIRVLLQEISRAYHLGGLVAPSWCTGNVTNGLVGNTSDLSFVATV